MAAASFFDIIGPGDKPAEEEGIFPQLTYKERIIGFVACSVLGLNSTFNIRLLDWRLVHPTSL